MECAASPANVIRPSKLGQGTGRQYVRDRTKAGEPSAISFTADANGSQKVLEFSFITSMAVAPSTLGDSPRQMRVTLKHQVEGSSDFFTSSTSPALASEQTVVTRID